MLWFMPVATEAVRKLDYRTAVEALGVKTQCLTLKGLVAISQVGTVDSSTPVRLPRWGPRPVPASSWRTFSFRSPTEGL